MNYQPLDLNRAAVNQHGVGARAVVVGSRSHLWDWRAEKGGQYYSLDMTRAAQEQYGPGWFAAYNGVHAYDWVACNLAGAGYKVLPILIVPADLFFQTDYVRWAMGRYANNCHAARAWYGQHTGRSFQLMEPLACYSPKSSDEWDHFCYLNTLASAENKERLLNESVAAFEAAYPFRGENLRITLCSYTGQDVDDWNGAMNRGKYRSIPPRGNALSIDMNNLQAGSLEADALYAFIHELGHGFDLPHPSDRSPQPAGHQQSFMQATKPPFAVVLEIERAELAGNRYFTG